VVAARPPATGTRTAAPSTYVLVSPLRRSAIPCSHSSDSGTPTRAELPPQSLQAVSDLRRRISVVAESPAKQQRTAVAREARRAVPSNQVGATRNPTR
jgi:hypothetical protein